LLCKLLKIQSGEEIGTGFQQLVVIHHLSALHGKKLRIVPVGPDRVRDIAGFARAVDLIQDL
jgi:hypothetical protein